MERGEGRGERGREREENKNDTIYIEFIILFISRGVKVHIFSKKNVFFLHHYNSIGTKEKVDRRGLRGGGGERETALSDSRSHPRRFWGQGSSEHVQAPLRWHTRPRGELH